MQPKYIESVRKNNNESDEAFYLDFLEKSEGKKILEVGCFNSPLLKRFNENIIGYDLCAPTKYEIHQNYKMLDFMDSKLQGVRFDVALCKDSHLYFSDPHALVHKMLLCSKSVVLSSVEPNFYPYITKLVFSSVKRFAKFWGVRNWDLDYSNTVPLINLMESRTFGSELKVNRRGTRIIIEIMR